MKNTFFFAALLLAELTSPGAEPPPLRAVLDDAELLQKGRGRPQKNALARLAVHPDEAAEKVLLAQFVRLREGTLPPALWLDLFEAAAKRGTPALKKELAERAEFVATSKDPLMQYRECLEGGDGEAGKRVFHREPEPGCIRCHSIDGKGGEIGPDLTWLRNAAERSNLLESVVLPNGTMAVGYQSALLKLKNGSEITGVVTRETSSDLILTTVADGKKHTIAIDDIVKRTALPSPMPPHFGVALTRRELRDLIEYLASGE